MSYIEVWKNMFTNKKYLFIFIISSFAFYILNSFLLQFKYITDYSIKTLFNLIFVGPYYLSYTSISFIFMILLTLSTGLLMSLLFYRYNATTKLSDMGLISSLGIFLGLAATGCVSCGIGLAAILGLSSILLILPFQGTELYFLALIIISYSIARTTKSFISCKVQRK